MMRRGLVMLLVSTLLLLALPSCRRKSPPTSPTGPFGEVKPPPKSAEAAKQDWERGRQRAEEAQREEAQKPRVITVEGLTEILRIENVSAALCGDLEGNGSFRIIGTFWSQQGRDIQREMVMYDVKGSVHARWPVKHPGYQMCLVQADDDREKEIVIVYHGPGHRQSELTVYEVNGSSLWNHEEAADLYLSATPDLNGHDKTEYVIVTREGGEARGLKLLDADGAIRWERNDLGSICPIETGDLDGDGTQEIVVEHQHVLGVSEISILDARGVTIRSFSGGDIAGLDGLQGVADIVPESPGPEILVSTTSRVGSFASGFSYQRSLAALTADGKILRSWPVDDLYELIWVTDLVPTSSGPEMLVSTFSPSAGKFGVAVLSGDGTRLFDVPLARRNASHREGIYYQTVGEFLVVVRPIVHPQLLILDSRGQVVGNIEGFDGLELVGADDSSGIPTIIVIVLQDRTRSLVAYTLEKE